MKIEIEKSRKQKELAKAKCHNLQTKISEISKALEELKKNS